ncbi:MAG TPA: ATPase, T2SS/T4P/T4SS family [Chloroflexota bacterium]|nr:ATPase, T2SS/T4P/T4SS family [Chloroflexota bacterium]
MIADRAERELRRITRDALGVLLEQHPNGSAAEQAAHIRAMIHDEVVGYQRRAATLNEPLLSDPTETEQRLVDELLGLGPIESLMRDPDVESIFINAPTRVYVVRGGHIERVPHVRFEDDAQVRDMVKRLASSAGRRFDESAPRADLGLPDGSRLHAVMAPVSSQFTEVTIRRFTRRNRRLDDLVGDGALTVDLARFLSAVVKARVNLVFSGDGGTGKTTMLRAAALEIDHPDERVVVIEHTRELGLEQLLPHALGWQERIANSEGLGAITQGELLHEDALRSEPSRILIGEVRGPEAWVLLKAMNTGHRGSMSTIHASSGRDAIDRLTVAAMEAPVRPSEELLTKLIATNLQLVLHLEKRDGRRMVTQVFEITGREGTTIAGHDLWIHRDGRLVRTGLRPRCLDRVASAEVTYAWEVAAA